MPVDDTKSQPELRAADERAVSSLVTVESQREFDLFSGRRAERTFLKLYVEARTSGLLAAISDRDWKTLCTLATYMDEDGYCYPSQAELARALGCSRQMANERVKSLARFRFQGKPVLLLEKEERTEQGRWARNGYRVMPVASLSIFDDADRTPADRRKAAVPKWAQRAESPSNVEESSVSRSLDTAPGDEGTVSSRTVTVGLDTNQNQDINQISIISNLRKVKPSEQGEPQEPEGEPHATDQPSRHPGGDVEPIRSVLNRRGYRPTQQTIYDEDRDIILAYISDFSREFSDRAPLKSSTTRALNLYRQSGLERQAFIDALYQARVITKERTAAIRGAGDTTPAPRAKNKMAYYFAVLEDLLHLRDDAADPLPSP